MTMNTQTKTKAVDALVILSNIRDTVAPMKEQASKATKALSEVFIAVLHTPKMNATKFDVEMAAIVKATAVKLGLDTIKEGQLHSSWRQYKSDVRKCICQTMERPKARAALRTMSAVKKFILSQGKTDKLAAQIRAFKKNADKVKDLAKKNAHNEWLSQFVDKALADLKAYADKHAISLEAPLSAKEEKDMKAGKVTPSMEVNAARKAAGVVVPIIKSVGEAELNQQAESNKRTRKPRGSKKVAA